MKLLTSRVSPEDAGVKLKTYLRSRIGLSYSQYTSLKARNCIFVNGVPRHANHILAAGDEVRVDMEEQTPSSAPPEDMPVDIVYEDEDVFVVDKPAPLSTVYSLKKGGGTLENRLAARFGDGFVFRPLSRLDKGTSGLLCAAKSAHAYQLLQKTLHTDACVREYLAIAEGTIDSTATLRFPIARESSASVRRVVDEGGKSAVTHMLPAAQAGGRTLLLLRLETGRTHQIRVHLSHIGHPVSGDFLYGTELSALLPGRFALHSCRIAFRQPLTGEAIERVSLPADLLSAFGFSLNEKQLCAILDAWKQNSTD